MTLLSEAYSEFPPEILYHYTTQEGLLGILNSRSVWATHTQYLNDRREYLHALDMVRDRLDFIKNDGDPEPWIIEALDAMRDGLVGIEGQCVCVFSLSEQSDSLSQWRAYGGSNSGYAIGISRETLVDACKKHNFKIGKCIYELELQKNLISELVGTVLDEALSLRKPGIVNWRESVGEKMADLISQYGPLLKHEGFRDEQEWRVISGRINPIAIDFQFRTGASTLVPYFRICLNKSDDMRFCPARVIIGPTPNFEEAKHAVRLLLVRRRMTECALTGVALSGVPYRSW